MKEQFAEREQTPKCLKIAPGEIPEVVEIENTLENLQDYGYQNSHRRTIQGFSRKRRP